MPPELVDKSRAPIFFVGKLESDILGAKLPSRRQILCFIYFRVHECNESVRDSSLVTATKVMGFWQNARIPTKEKKNIVTLVEKLHEEWRSIQRNAKRQT